MSLPTDDMQHPATTCDPRQLQLLLADQLQPAAQTALADHITHCEHCQRTLEQLAADPPLWADVETSFRGADAASGLSSTAAFPPQSDAWPADEAHVADFAVSYLEPCDQPGTIGRLGDYEILEVIGAGGMGIVLKGFHRELGRYVAVKVMAPHLGTSGAARQRFIREARAAAGIVHPNVMPIHAVCTSARLPYLVMPFVACESLQQRIDRQGPLAVHEVLQIGSQVAAGLAAAHAQGLVHRDIKPANVLLEIGVERAMLTDFGLARAADDGSLTRTGIVAGTPQYMSPEQAQGDPLDGRSDLFSLGSVLYTMAAGRPPFRAETALGILRRISDTQPRRLREINPEIPGWLEQFVSRLHAKSPDQRLSSATEAAHVLEQCLAHVRQPLVVPLPEIVIESNLHPAPAARRRPRRRTVITVVSALTVLVAGAAGWQAWGPRVAKQPELSTPDTATAGAGASVAAQADYAPWTDEEIEAAAGQFRAELQDVENQVEAVWEGWPLDAPTTAAPVALPATPSTP